MKISFVLITLPVMMACSSSKNSSNAKQHSASDNNTNSTTIQQKQSEGVDLFARGKSVASWTLEIDFDKAIRFKSIDGNNIIATSVKPVESADGKHTTITTSTEFGKMQIDISEEGCTDALSGEKFDKKVSVTVNNKTYEGCGRFLHDPAINGKWTLQQWNGKKLTASEFAKGLPQIQFDAETSRLMGHDGCNQIFGDMELRGNFIVIKTIGSTKMACLKNNKDVELAAKISNQTISYFFKDGLLHLYLPDDSIAVFSKA